MRDCRRKRSAPCSYEVTFGQGPLWERARPRPRRPEAGPPRRSRRPPGSPSRSRSGSGPAPHGRLARCRRAQRGRPGAASRDAVRVEDQALALFEAALVPGESSLAPEQSERELRLGHQLLDRVVCSEHQRRRVAAVHPAERRVDGMPAGDDGGEEELRIAHVVYSPRALSAPPPRRFARCGAPRVGRPDRCHQGLRRPGPCPPRRRSRSRRRRGSPRSRTSPRPPRSSEGRRPRARRHPCARCAAARGSAGVQPRGSSPSGAGLSQRRPCSRRQLHRRRAVPGELVKVSSDPRTVSKMPIARPRSHIGAIATPGSSDSSRTLRSGTPSAASSGPSASGASMRAGNSSAPASRSKCVPSMSSTYRATGGL